MTTGYDEKGMEDLICVGPPGGEEEFLPTAFYSGSFAGDEFPTYDFGVADFSFEVWVKWCQGNDSPGADVTTWFGAFDVTAPGGTMYYGGGVAVNPGAYNAACFYNSTPGVGIGVHSGYQTIPLGWSYLAFNFDRSGNLDHYINGVQVGLQPAIDLVNVGTLSFAPNVSAELDLRTAVMLNNDANNWYDNIISRIWTGRMAMHNRLLTTAEIQDSYSNQRVQNISGVTKIMWDPREVTGHTGWETRPDYLASLMRGGLHLPWGAPLGTYGTVVIPDLSGNGNDLPLPVASAYQAEQTAGLGVGSRARCCFIADPWWR